MVGPPSITRSHGLADCCENFLLTDPFRALHPDRRDFTYYPRTRRANRSRIDFFIISDSLLPAVSLCEISPFISTELFNHKSVSLTLNKPNFKPNQSISLSILSHPVFCMWWLVLQPSAISNMWTPMLRPTWRVWSWRGASKKSVGSFLRSVR